jgi:hypothetical protein
MEGLVRACGVLGWGKGVRGLQTPRCPKLRMPDSLHTFATRSWASPGGATLYNKAPPVSPELEKRIIHGLLSDLNRNFDLGLDTDPDLTRCKEVNSSSKPKILTLGGSHAGRISDEFEFLPSRVIFSAAAALTLLTAPTSAWGGMVKKCWVSTVAFAMISRALSSKTGSAT